MKRVLVIISVLVLLIATLMAGCSGNKSTPTFADSTQVINLNVNQEFIIALQANPTTGYDWQPVFDAGFIGQDSKTYKQDDSSGQPMVGSGGTDFFTFKALKIGETKIAFTYYRPWETPKPEDKQQVFNIIIK